MRRKAPSCKAGIEGGGIIPDGAYVVHGRGYGPCGAMHATPQAPRALAKWFHARRRERCAFLTTASFW